jgi:hypothetical protein
MRPGPRHDRMSFVTRRCCDKLSEQLPCGGFLGRGIGIGDTRGTHRCKAVQEAFRVAFSHSPAPPAPKSVRAASTKEAKSSRVRTAEGRQSWRAQSQRPVSNCVMRAAEPRSPSLKPMEILGRSLSVARLELADSGPRPMCCKRVTKTDGSPLS